MSTQGRGRVLGRVMTYNGTTAWLRQQGGNGRDIIAYEGDLPGAIRAGNLEGRVAEIRDLPNEIKAVATQLSLVPPHHEQTTRIAPAGFTSVMVFEIDQ